MNAENLKQVRDVIASNPDQYDQGFYTHRCGTPACIAGWAASLSLKPGEMLIASSVATEGVGVFLNSIHNRARMWLGLSPHDAGRMFNADPLVRCDGGDYYHDKPTVLEALAMLDHAIEAGEVVWKELPRVSEGEGV